MEISGGVVAGRDTRDMAGIGESECHLFLLLLDFSDIVVEEELTLSTFSIITSYPIILRD